MINTQKLSRVVLFTEDIDIYKTLFDKTNIIQTTARRSTPFDKPAELSNLLKHIDYAALSVRKNAIRGKKMESNEYYRGILINVLEYLRKKAGISEKADFGFKHIHKDIPHEESGKLEDFYFANPVDSIEPLKSWLKSI